MMKRLVLLGAFAIILLLPTTLLAGDLVRSVRFKLSAGDIYSGASAAENYLRENEIVKRILFDILAGIEPRHMRAKDTDGEKERLLVFPCEELACPGGDFRIWPG